MDNEKIAKELVKVARELMAVNINRISDELSKKNRRLKRSEIDAFAKALFDEFVEDEEHYRKRNGEFDKRKIDDELEVGAFDYYVENDEGEGIENFTAVRSKFNDLLIKEYGIDLDRN